MHILLQGAAATALQKKSQVIVRMDLVHWNFNTTCFYNHSKDEVHCQEGMTATFSCSTLWHAKSVAGYRQI